ncbi:hypothetical protein ACFLZL_02265 [Thermodesulfobacteriota bacterium]
MQREELYHHLKDIAEKLNVRVTEENLKKTGPRVKSGFCKVKDQKKFIMDKHASNQKKAEILASFISGLVLDAIYIVPVVREYIDQCGDQIKKNNDSEN